MGVLFATGLLIVYPIAGWVGRCLSGWRRAASTNGDLCWWRHRRDALTRFCQSASNWGSDSPLVVSGLHGPNNASLEKVEVSAAIHLAFDELEFRDLSLGLAVRPG